MRKKLEAVLLAMAMLAAIVSAGWAAPGDVNGEGGVELGDAIMALQVSAGMTPASVNLDADVNESNTISMEEAVYALQIVAGLRIQSFTNSLGMTFNLIPAGMFMMGSPEDELGREDDEGPQHQVTLTNSFYIQTTEVTQEQWKAVMNNENPSYFEACGDNCPVEQVSWYDVQDFITAMNARGEGTYRLPTEAEWEYAARGGSGDAFANGAITYIGTSPLDPNLDTMGWYYGNSAVDYTPNSYGRGTHPVGQKLTNNYGLYDMHGNVLEWCQDWYDGYPSGSITNPAGPSNGSSRILRGGSWHYAAGRCRSAYRDWFLPDLRAKDGGFRLVLVPGQ